MGVKKPGGAGLGMAFPAYLPGLGGVPADWVRIS